MTTVRPAVLFSYFRSSSAYRVRIALNLKNVPYEIRPVNLLNGEQNLPEFKAISPMAAVPVLQIDGHTFTQSLPIVDYLDATRRDPKLCPSDPFGRSNVLAMAMVPASDTQPLHNALTLKTLGELFDADEKKKHEWVGRFMKRSLGVLEHEIGRFSTTAEFCYGHHVSLADVCLAPHIYVAKRFNVPLDEYPKTMKVYQNLMTIDAFRRAHPHSQPDCIAELKGDLSV